MRATGAIYTFPNHLIGHLPMAATNGRRMTYCQKVARNNPTIFIIGEIIRIRIIFRLNCGLRVLTR